MCSWNMADQCTVLYIIYHSIMRLYNIYGRNNFYTCDFRARHLIPVADMRQTLVPVYGAMMEDGYLRKPRLENSMVEA